MNLNPFRHQKTIVIKKDDFPQFLSLLNNNVSSNQQDQTNKHFQGTVTEESIFLQPIPNYVFNNNLSYFTVTATREPTADADTTKITFHLKMDKAGYRNLLLVLSGIILYGIISHILSYKSFMGPDNIGLYAAPVLCILVIFKLSIQFSMAQGALNAVFVTIGNRLGYSI